MAYGRLIAVFGNVEDADAARTALLHAGFPADDLTVSAELTDDGIAAEVPGQAYANQTSETGAGLIALIKSTFTSTQGEDAADAQNMAHIQRGAAVLTISGISIDGAHVESLIQAHRPISVRQVR